MADVITAAEAKLEKQIAKQEKILKCNLQQISGLKENGWEEYTFVKTRPYLGATGGGFLPVKLYGGDGSTTLLSLRYFGDAELDLLKHSFADCGMQPYSKATGPHRQHAKKILKKIDEGFDQVKTSNIYPYRYNSAVLTTDFSGDGKDDTRHTLTFRSAEDAAKFRDWVHEQFDPKKRTETRMTLANIVAAVAEKAKERE